MPHLHFLILCPSAFVFFFTNRSLFQRPFLFLFWKWLPSFLYKLTPWGRGEVCNYAPLSPSHLKLHAELHTVSSHLVSSHSLKRNNVYVRIRYSLPRSFQFHIAVNERTNLRYNKLIVNFKRAPKFRHNSFFTITIFNIVITQIRSNCAANVNVRQMKAGLRPAVVGKPVLLLRRTGWNSCHIKDSIMSCSATSTVPTEPTIISPIIPSEISYHVQRAFFAFLSSSLSF